MFILNKFLEFFVQDFVTFFCIIVMIVFGFAYKNDRTKVNKYFFVLGLLFFSESLRCFIENYLTTLTSGYESRIYVSCLGYILRPAIFYCILLIMEKDDKLNIKLGHGIPLLITSIMMIITPFTGSLILSFPNNQYSPTTLLLIPKYINLLYLILVVIVAIKKAKNDLNESIIIYIDAAFVLFNFINEVIYPVTYKNLQNDAIALSVLLYYMYYISKIHKTEIEAKELEIENTKIELSEKIIDQAIETLAYTVDSKDQYTRLHSIRVAKYARMIATEYGLSEEECRKVYLAGLLHDIGKISIPLAIINKEGKLTDEEYAQMKSHSMNGAKILKRMKDLPFLQDGAMYHHARYDGNGYPKGISGEDIPEIARIIAVADTYDAMTSYRSYRGALEQGLVRQELWKCYGTQLDPKFVKIMIALIDADKNQDMYEKKGEEEEFFFQNNYVSDKKKNKSTKNNDEIVEIQIESNARFAEFVLGVEHWINPDLIMNLTENETNNIEFFSKSKDYADRIWHAPAIIVYSSSDGSISAEDYIEYSVIKATGYAWNVWPARYDNEKLIKNNKFKNWDEWLKSNISGMNYTLNATLKDNVVKGHITNEYFDVEFEVGLPENSDNNIHIAITGENCDIKERK